MDSWTNLGTIVLGLADATVEWEPTSALRLAKAGKLADRMIELAKTIQDGVYKAPEKDRDRAWEALSRTAGPEEGESDRTPEKVKKVKDYIRMATNGGNVDLMMIYRMDELGIPFTYNPEEPTGR